MTMLKSTNPQHLPSVTKAKYVKDYLIEVKFNDGTMKVKSSVSVSKSDSTFASVLGQFSAAVKELHLDIGRDQLVLAVARKTGSLATLFHAWQRSKTSLAGHPTGQERRLVALVEELTPTLSTPEHRVVAGPSQNRTWSVTPSGSQWSPSHRVRIKIMDDAHTRHPGRYHRPVARPTDRALLTAAVQPLVQELKREVTILAHAPRVAAHPQIARSIKLNRSCTSRSSKLGIPNGRLRPSPLGI
jgi:hypothetical protein